MMHLQRLPKFSSGTSLAIIIKELEKPEKEYEKFRFKLKDNEWKYINVVGKDTHESEICVFTDLLYDMTYKISAEYKLNGEWAAIPDRTFITQDFGDIPKDIKKVSGGVFMGSDTK